MDNSEMSFEFRNKKLKELIEFISDNPNKFTVQELSDMFGLSEDAVAASIRRAKKMYDLKVRSGRQKEVVVKKRVPYIPPAPNTQNVLVIGDLHEPFTLDGYREFCYEVYKQYKITHVIFIGDIIDGHAWSFHEPDPDGMSPGDELHEAKERIKAWYKLFPKADVILGNHDLLFMRKAFHSGIPRELIMDLKDIFETPKWTFYEDGVVYDAIQYLHGLGSKARAQCRKDLMSTVQGHHHTDAYTEYVVGKTYKIFGMQVGCGVDRKSYAMAYARHFPKQAIGVGVILNHGKLPINLLMEL